MLGPEIETVLTSMASAVVYSLIFYAKERAKKDPEDLNIAKLGATIVVGGVVGIFYGYYGIPVKQPTITEQLATYTGTIALVESVLKTAIRSYNKKYSNI